MTDVLLAAPCRGRHEQTLESLSRLMNSTGTGSDVIVTLICVVDGDPALAKMLIAQGYKVIQHAEPKGYWVCMQAATRARPSKYVVNLANDLLPGVSWLQRAIRAYANRFGESEGVIGFNDGVHTGQHAAHMLISRNLLVRMYGEELWPTCYRHNFGDTEITARAKEQGLFAIAPWAVLYHNHALTGNRSDSVYDEGSRTWNEDSEMFNARRQSRWS